VKMMEYILQRLSPSAKQRMLKMKNRRLSRTPSDFIDSTPRWTPSIHFLFPLECKQVVKAVLMLAAKRQDGTPYYPQTHFYKLHKDLLFVILQHAITKETQNQPRNVEFGHFPNCDMNMETTQNEINKCAGEDTIPIIQFEHSFWG
jgi:hypothetical protein